MKKLITLSLLLLTAVTLSAQVKIVEMNKDAYFTLDQYKTSFHYRYAPTDSIPSHISTNLSLLFGGAVLSADVSIVDGWVVLKRIKLVQPTNMLSNASINVNIEQLFYKYNGKQVKAKKLLKRGNVWYDSLITLIKQY